jgi:hypothetical protein
MKPFPEDPTFTPGEKGFDGEDENGRPYDLLGRKPMGQRLTDLLDRVEQPLVIALDGGWGSGKSHFLKLWTGAHEKELGGKAKIIYFDAFEHDYLDDPLISLVARLITKEAEITWGNKAVKAIKKAALPLAKLGLRIGAAAATAGATEVVGPIADAVVTKTGEATQASIDAFWKRETSRIAAMQQFRDALTSLTKDGESGQKIVFIIDELDRCRPDYALTLLEIVKHFFAVPNVHFVLGANVAALENSVRARYGSEIRAREYLMKFIHLRLTFPIDRDHQGNGPWARYFDATYKQMGLGTNSVQSLRDNLSIINSSTQVSLRDIQRALSRLALFPKEFETFNFAYQRLGTSALLLETFAPEHFSRLRSGTLEINQVLQIFPMNHADSTTKHSAEVLNHLWRRVTMPDPGEETRKITAGSFGHYSGDLPSGYFNRLWSELFDTFQIQKS